MTKTLIELRADFQHLRRWRKSVEQAQSFTFKAVITIIVTGFVGAVWLGSRSCSVNDPRNFGCDYSGLVSRAHHSLLRAVAQYGEAAVESWARASGISDKDIEQAKRCLR